MFDVPREMHANTGCTLNNEQTAHKLGTVDMRTYLPLKYTLSI